MRGHLIGEVLDLGGTIVVDSPVDPLPLTESGNCNQGSNCKVFRVYDTCFIYYKANLLDNMAGELKLLVECRVR